jgi:protein-S-isoprenylcysteine O-methyltransferase Ste14
MAPSARKLWKHRAKDALIYWLYIPSAVIGSGVALDVCWQVEKLPASAALSLAALSFITLGVILVQRATSDLARIGGGTPNPKAPAKRLVTSSSYRLCRHPMYLGYDLTALGTVLLFRSPGMLLVSYPAFIALEVRYLLQEEKRLAKRFGDAFLDYQRAVPFLIPFLHKEN